MIELESIYVWTSGMRLSYKELSSSAQNFAKLTGVTVKEFGLMLDEIREDYCRWEDSKSPVGRHSNFGGLEDKLLCLLIYYRTYITHTFLGYLFGVHNSNVCRMFKVLEPMVAKRLGIKKDRRLNQDQVMAILSDVTEINTQRPKYQQKHYYSGKKKRHTLKSEISILENGRIINVSKVYRGRVHDFAIRKKQKSLPTNAVKIVDSGYQGLQKIASNVWLPFKRSKKRPLSSEQKQHNKALAQLRVKIEHKIAQFKTFKILADKYRNFQKKLNLRLNIIAGIVNIRHGF